jgi:4-amino-4-deoxy-L-arabinose transferase-like glycosyltransferase
LTGAHGSTMLITVSKSESEVGAREFAPPPRWRQRIAASGVPPWLLVLLAGLPLMVFFIDLGTPSLWDPDEGLAAEVAREMLLTRRWLTPQLNFLPYSEKPPAYFWVLAVAMRLFGTHNEAAIRLPSALIAVAGVWLVVAWGWRHLRPVAGAFAGLVLTTTAGYVAIGRLAIEDAAAGLLLSIALLGMSEPLISRRTGFPWIFYASLAAAVFSVGPAALLLPPLVAVPFVMLIREPGRLPDLQPLRGLGLLSAALGPVFALAAAHDPAYVKGLLGEHSLIRFLDPNFSDAHSYSLASFLLITPLLTLPWGVFLPWTMRDALRSGGERSSQARLFLLVWLIADAVFFMLTAANLVTYVVIALVPLALLTGRALSRFVRRPRPDSVFTDPVLFAAGILFLVVLSSPFLTRRVLQNEFPMYADKIVFGFLLIPFALAGVGAVVRRNRLGALGAVASCGVVTLVVLYHFGSETVTAYNSMEMPADLIALRLPPSAPLVSYGTTSHTLAFYSGRPVHLLPNVREASPLLNADAPIALLTKERFLPEVRAELRRALYIWWIGDSKKVLLANLPPPPDSDRRILLPAPAGK